METWYQEGEYDKLLEKAETWRQKDRASFPPKWVFTFYKAKAYFALAAARNGRSSLSYYRRGKGMLLAVKRASKDDAWQQLDSEFMDICKNYMEEMATQALVDMNMPLAYQYHRGLAEVFHDSTEVFRLLENEAYIHEYNTDNRSNQHEIISFLFLRYVNQLRKDGCNCGGEWMPPAPPVSWSDTLSYTAKLHSLDMQTYEYFDHTGRDGSKPWDRAQVQGYHRGMMGENIAHGYQNEFTVFKGWVTSPGHCRNMMRQGYSEIGLGRSGTYWTMMLAN
ncbi:MAG: CAP domain-containing protein [Bacteroidota bacterium]